MASFSTRAFSGGGAAGAVPHGNWYRGNVAANQTNLVLLRDLSGSMSSNAQELPIAFPCTVVGCAVFADQWTGTTGNITFRLRTNGSTFTDMLALTGASGNGPHYSDDENISLAAGDRVIPVITTDASWDSTVADIQLVLWIKPA